MNPPVGVESFELREETGAYHCACADGHTRVWRFVPDIWAAAPGKRMIRGVRYPVSGAFKPDADAEGWHECICGKWFRFVPALR